MRFVPLSLLLAKTFLVSIPLTAADSSDTIGRPQPDTTIAHRVQVVLEGQGAIQGPAGGAKPGDTPLRMTAEFLYTERRLACGEGDFAARDYEYGRAEIDVAGRVHRPQLSDGHPWIAFQRIAGKTMIYAPGGAPLSQEERELLEVPAPSLLLDRLVPTGRTAIDGTWQLTDDDAADLFHLDAVSQNSLQGRFVRVQDGKAICELSGRIQGITDRVLSEQEIEAKFNVDLTSQRVVWLALLVRENRSESALRPGFTMQARIRVRHDAASLPPSLTDEHLGTPRPAEAPPVVRSIPLNGEFELTHDARWIVRQNRREKITLEFVDQAASLAQCTITVLPDLPVGKPVTRDEFRQDVETTLAKSGARVVDSQESVDDRLSVIRILTAGQTQSVPIQWVYYHATNPSGRRAVVVFTLKGEDADRFAGHDVQLVQGISFRDSADAAETKTADTNTGETKTAQSPTLEEKGTR